MRSSKFFILALILGLIGAFFLFDLQQYLTLASLKSRQAAFAEFYTGNRLLTIAGYMAIYILATALSLPGAIILTLAGGALFGLGIGFVAISFASSIGATLAFLAARFLLRDSVQSRFGERLRAINDGVRKEGAFYLFSLRLVPIFPFFLINLAMGLTPIRTRTFYWVSQLGMIPGTLVYVNAGTQLGQIDSLAGILSPGLLFSFVLLGLLPLLSKKTLDLVQSRKVLARFPKPKRFDYNLVVIGAGSAGLVTSYIAAAVKAKVALIEKARMGGDCLNTGCVPSKALIRAAKLIAYSRRGAEFGFKPAEVEVNFAAVMERVQQVVKTVEPHDSMERYQGLGVEVIQGAARIASPYSVEVNGRVLTSRAIVIASGAHPLVPPIPGLEAIDYLTSDNLWELRQLPARLIVLGGGPIGCEMTQAFTRLGSQVTQVEMAARILGREDEEISALIGERFVAEGVRLLTGHTAQSVRLEGERKLLLCQGSEGPVEIEFDQLLVAVGRAANVKGFGLEELGVQLSPRGTIAADPFLRTNFPTIFCAGDVTGPYQFTHTAGHQAWYAAVNALFGSFKKFAVDYRVIPWATFIDPEVARVGLNELEAKEQGIAYEVTRFELAELDRAIAEGETRGFVKVLTVPGKDKILGVTLVGPHAGDLIAEYVSAMKHGLGLNKILSTIHIYPTLAEANKMAAGEWKKAHVPQKLLHWVKRFHNWRRG
ncbi:MAG: FAD-dependent oxidoreductase [Trichloromonadaceae bacterium]